MITASSIIIILKKAEFFSFIFEGKIALHGPKEWKLKIGSKFILQDGE